MNLITMVFILNSTLLILHEIESGYEKEWEILKLPGKITGFLLLHIPIILILFYGLLEIDELSTMGLILGMISGIGGLCPFFIHKVLVRRKGRFDLLISNALIDANVVSGAILFWLSVRQFA